MIDSIVTELGPWNWMVLGLLLLGAEVLIPGFFLIWIGIAAVIVGALSLALWESGFWTWQVQVLVFLGVAIVAVFAGRAIMQRSDASDEPLLNRRSAQLIGRTATLQEAIVNGQGRVKLGDTTWSVSGPDLEAGAKVRITGAEDMKLTVEAA